METPFIDDLYDRLESDLLIIRASSTRPEEWAKQSIAVAQKCLAELKAHLMKHPFKRRSEEIEFFKTIKPPILGKLIFFVEVFNLIAREPSSKDDDSGYYRKSFYWTGHQDRIEAYFLKEKDFCNYLEGEDTSLDKQFFVRSPKNIFYYRLWAMDLDPVSFYGDPSFSTSHDYRLAKLLAYEVLREFIREQKDRLEKIKDLPRERLTFAGSPDDFVEFVRLFGGTMMNTETGKLLTLEELGDRWLQHIDADLGEFPDFKTLMLCSNGSDFGDRVQESIEKRRAEWEAEEEDAEYDTDEGGDSGEIPSE